ncbi:DNA-directed RNA polymerase II subunit RPB1 [Manis javanica]|nr:DNA-directed RNA polymerase II subunit RPB1 [Manis javanica]
MDVFTCRYKQGYKIHLKNACLYVVKSPGPPHSFPVVPAYGPGGQVKEPTSDHYHRLSQTAWPLCLGWSQTCLCPTMELLQGPQISACMRM